MAQMKSLNGYEVVDSTARNKVDDLKSNLFRNLFPSIETQYIKNAFDYNDMTTAGIYYLDNAGPAASANSPAANITNCYLIVINNTNRTRTTQIILPGNDSHIYYRNMYTDSNIWSYWRTVGTILYDYAAPSSSIGTDGDFFVMI